MGGPDMTSSRTSTTRRKQEILPTPLPSTDAFVARGDLFYVSELDRKRFGLCSCAKCSLCTSFMALSLITMASCDRSSATCAELSSFSARLGAVAHHALLASRA